MIVSLAELQIASRKLAGASIMIGVLALQLEWVMANKVNTMKNEQGTTDCVSNGTGNG